MSAHALHVSLSVVRQALTLSVCSLVSLIAIEIRVDLDGSEVQKFYSTTLMRSADNAVARRLSVCHTPVFYRNGYTYPQTFFTIE